MPNNLNVTLDKNSTPWAVDVDQHGKDNEVSQGPSAQTITWQLTGNAASGSFEPLTGSSPGFEWIDTPPAGIFGEPVLSNNGNQISISDLNNNANALGTWIYRLRVNVGGTVYSTKTASARMVATDPWIRNKT